MAASERLTEQGVLQIAAQVGLDAARLEKDMADPAVAEILARNGRLREALGIRGTPALIIGAELVPGAADFDTLNELVAQARKK
jgi:protein-disulfide isomerase